MLLIGVLWVQQDEATIQLSRQTCGIIVYLYFNAILGEPMQAELTLRRTLGGAMQIIFLS